MDVPVGILGLSVGTTLLVTVVAWLRARRARAVAAHRVVLMDHLDRLEEAPTPPTALHRVSSPRIAPPPPPPPPVAARAPSTRLPTPPILGYKLERLIDAYVAQAIQLTGTARSEARRKPRTPARGLASKIATKLAWEVAEDDEMIEELSSVTTLRLDELSDEVLLEVSRLLEIDPSDVMFDATSDPVIEPPQPDAFESGPVEPPMPRASSLAEHLHVRPRTWSEPGSDPTIEDACALDTDPSGLRLVSAIPARVFGLEVTPTPPLPPSRAPRASRRLTTVTVEDRDFEDEADTVLRSKPRPCTDAGMS